MNEKATTELEIEVSGGRITEAYVMPDGKCKLVIELEALKGASTVVTPMGDTFVKVEASKLNIDDKFMKYLPETEAEKKLKEMITTVIKGNPKDFWHPKYEPSFNKAGTGICYKPGMAPAVGKSYNWWEKVAKEFNPKCKSRLGTKSEYIAFLAVLIKKIVENGWNVADAWFAVCNNSKKTFEETGCREICGFFDCISTFKILAEDEENGGFWLAGGIYNYISYDFPLADLYRFNNRNNDYCDSVGWIVLDSCSDC